MKNVTVDASIIPQVLQYAFWAETNPDSIKSLWLECENKPDDLTISWDSFQGGGELGTLLTKLNNLNMKSWRRP